MNYQEKRNSSNYKLFDSFNTGALDEIFIRDIGEAMLFKSFMEAFWNTGGILVSTSNRPPMDLYENGINRALLIPFLRRLQEECEIIEVSHSIDYRMGKEASLRQCFFDDLTNFRKDFLLTSTEPGSAVEHVEFQLPGLDRSITTEAIKSVKTDREYIVYSTFEELCRSNKSVNDYKALVANAHTIYLSSVDMVGDENAVTRFIQLVDVAYEGKTSILIHSNTSPSLSKIMPQLSTSSDTEATAPVQETKVVGKGGSSSSASTTYIGEIEWSATGLKDASLASGSSSGAADNAFSQKRTLSRLVEMHSKEWD